MKKIKILFILAGILLVIFFAKIIYENSYIGKSEMPTYEITYHNPQFEGYFGNRVSGSNVRVLLVQIKSNNEFAKSKNESIGNYIFVKINDEEVSEFEEIVDNSSIKKSSTYTVTYGGDKSLNDSTEAIGTYWTNGHIKYIIIKENVDTVETNEINYSEERNE